VHSKPAGNFAQFPVISQIVVEPGDGDELHHPLRRAEQEMLSGEHSIKVALEMRQEGGFRRISAILMHLCRGRLCDDLHNSLEIMEAEEGIEPSNSGFANRCLTTWLLRRLTPVARGRFPTSLRPRCQCRG
jgi:hypothetical protein